MICSEPYSDIYTLMSLLIILPLKLLIFFWNTMDYVFVVNVVIATSKMFDITAPLMKCVMWQWGNDIIVNTHCDVTGVNDIV